MCSSFSRHLYGISIFVTYYAIMRLIRDWLIVTGGGNRSTRRKSPPNPESLVAFSHAQVVCEFGQL